MILSKTNHISFTLKRIRSSSDIDSSVTLKTIVIYVICVYDIEYQILKPYIRFVFDSIAFR